MWCFIFWLVCKTYTSFLFVYYNLLSINYYLLINGGSSIYVLHLHLHASCWHVIKHLWFQPFMKSWTSGCMANTWSQRWLPVTLKGTLRRLIHPKHWYCHFMGPLAQERITSAASLLKHCIKMGWRVKMCTSSQPQKNFRIKKWYLCIRCDWLFTYCLLVCCRCMVNFYLFIL